MNQKLKIKKFGDRAFGFTLAELLMVVVILGILSAVALPRFAPQKEKAYVAEAVGMLSAIRQGEEAYRLETGGYLSLAKGAGSATTEWDKIGLERPAATDNYWDYDVVPDAGPGFTATATRTVKRASTTNKDKKITLTNAGVYGGDHPNHPE